jgi:hypothetical protein
MTRAEFEQFFGDMMKRFPKQKKADMNP